MAISLAGHTGVLWPGSSSNIQTLSYTSSGGNTLILTFGIYTPSTDVNLLSVTDSASNTWQYSTANASNPAYAHIQASTGAYITSFVAWSMNAAAVTSVTITATGTTDWQGALSEWSGVMSVESGAESANASTTTAITSPSVTLGNAGDLVVAHAENDGGLTSTTATDFGNGQDPPGACYSLPGATGPFTITWGNNGHGAAVAVMVFSPVAAPVSYVPPLMSQRTGLY